MNDRYTFACTIARKAGALALDFWNRRDELVIELKGPGDFVSVADREIQRRAKQYLIEGTDTKSSHWLSDRES